MRNRRGLRNLVDDYGRKPPVEEDISAYPTTNKGAGVGAVPAMARRAVRKALSKGAWAPPGEAVKRR